MKKYNNEYVIIRSDRAGIFAGNIESRNGQEVILKNARRLWYWDGACSISQLAVDGTLRPKDCKFTVTVEEIEIFGVIEIIPCTEKAEQSIKKVINWEK